MISSMPSKWDVIIEKDLHRTFVDESIFLKQENNHVILHKVLKAYAVFDKKVGYTQGSPLLTQSDFLGMNLIAGAVIQYLTE